MRGLALPALVVAAMATAASETAPEARRSGYDFAGPEIRAMQDDNTANPGMLWVMQGETLWARKAGATDQSCADCHGDARTSMKGVAARYPTFDAALNRPIDLEQLMILSRAALGRSASLFKVETLPDPVDLI
jgi:L-cysteine S-thiosulfotransferase